MMPATYLREMFEEFGVLFQPRITAALVRALGPRIELLKEIDAYSASVLLATAIDELPLAEQLECLAPCYAEFERAFRCRRHDVRKLGITDWAN